LEKHKESPEFLKIFWKKGVKTPKKKKGQNNGGIED
jgi:hypothetical protein